MHIANRLVPGFHRGAVGSIELVSFFFSSRRRHTRFLSDWSSDVCSSDLVTVKLPPLRDRLEDIPHLARFFLERFSRRYGKSLSASPRFRSEERRVRKE